MENSTNGSKKTTWIQVLALPLVAVMLNKLPEVT
jgi:hypothetical protein